ncbi:MAG TPA: site-specific integrase [Puia sp.]|jgi:site-specific recombinase XerD|nr:site-specific integrase [Puia sp.]
MISKSFGLLFYLKKQHGDTKVHRPIYLRITVDGVMKEMSIHRSWDPTKWNAKAGWAIVPKTPPRRSAAPPECEAQSLNAYLDTLQAKVHEARHQLLMSGKPVTAEALRNFVQGREAGSERPHLLLEIFQYHNDQVKALIGKEFSKGTLTKFNTVLKHTRSFLQWKYKLDDIDIRKLDYEFITELEFWYKSVQRVEHNTTMKYIACVKKMAIRALRNGWLQRDPFMGFNMALREIEREALTVEELERMTTKSFITERLSQVRDIFLFSCFTGLAYADLQKLKRSEISTGIDGGKWIFTRRQKTDTASRIPLLPMAQQILDKYFDHPLCLKKDKVLPILSNQKMNQYLKEIADVCQIDKYLTFHIARHTFATTITLSNGVPIETVSKMLGHRNLKTTQHYAKIVDRKVSNDMQALKERLSLKPILKGQQEEKKTV